MTIAHIPKTTAKGAKTNNTYGRTSWHWALWILVALMLGTFYYGMRKTTLTIDDAYITFRYAKNIALGRGFVFNEGESVLGTTTPLYALLLATLAKIWTNIPWMSHYIGTVAWLLSIPMIYRLGKLRTSNLPGLVAAMVLASNGIFALVLGMETTFYIMLLIATVYLYRLKHPSLAAVAAGLAFITRWDGVLMIGALLFAVFMEQGKKVWRPALIATLIVGLWLAYSQFTFGSIFPNTFFAKMGQGNKANLGGTEFGTFADGIKIWVRILYTENKLFVAMAIFAGIGVIAAVIQRVRWWPLALWTTGYVTGYIVLGVMNYGWYYPPLIPLLSLLVGSGASLLVNSSIARIRAIGTRAGRQRGSEWARRGLLLGVTLLVLTPNLALLRGFSSPVPNAHTQTYIETGQWLANNTPEDASVALLEIGAIGYYSDRTIVDAMGLVSPHMIGHLEDWLQVLLYAVNSKWPDYVVALNNTAWEAVVQQPWFREMYHHKTQILNPPDVVSPVDIYGLRDGFPIRDFAIATTPGLTFDDEISLRKIQIAESTVDQGDALRVQLTWNALTDIEEYYRIGFDLVSVASGERWIMGDGFTPLNGGNPTPQWRSGDTVVDFHSLPIWGEVPPGSYILSPRVSRSDGSPAIVTEDATTSASPSINIRGTQASQPADAVFADSLNLKGYDLTLDPLTDEFTVTLYWEAEDAITENYTVFVHLIDSQGQLMMQDDSRPRRPTHIWKTGTREIDQHRFQLEQQSYNKPFEVLIGLYPWPDLNRVPIYESSGMRISDNALVLGSFEFVETNNGSAVETLSP